MRNALETFAVGNKIVSIYHDDNPESPRSWDNLGTMVCFHSRYSLGDKKHGYRDPSDFIEEWIKPHVGRKGAVVLPLYLYDHSGITMSTSAFSCPWDSGQVGWIFVDYDTIRKEYGCKRVTAAVKAKVEEVLRQEVEDYDAYLTGDVYGFIIATEDDDHAYSGWGICRLGYCRKEARSVALCLKG